MPLEVKQCQFCYILFIEEITKVHPASREIVCTYWWWVGRQTIPNGARLFLENIICQNASSGQNNLLLSYQQNEITPFPGISHLITTSDSGVRSGISSYMLGSCVNKTRFQWTLSWLIDLKTCELRKYLSTPPPAHTHNPYTTVRQSCDSNIGHFT